MVSLFERACQGCGRTLSKWLPSRHRQSGELAIRIKCGKCGTITFVPKDGTDIRTVLHNEGALYADWIKPVIAP